VFFWFFLAVYMIVCFVYFCFNSICYVFLLLCLLLCVLYIPFSSGTLTEVFPCFFLSCKVNARVYLAKTGHGTHSSYFVNCIVPCIVWDDNVLFYVLFDCVVLYIIIYVNVYYCHRVSTQLQLNISYQYHKSHITGIYIWECNLCSTDKLLFLCVEYCVYENKQERHNVSNFVCFPSTIN
jgi:hypothetical protein